jgi:site-specific recombinase XerD
LKRYSGIFSLFENFLSEVGRTVHNAETEDVLSFIQDYVDDRKAESTIRSVYSAILFHFRLCGRQDFLEKNPIIQMFVRGAQRLAPAPLKKNVIWDPETPLSFISSRPRPTKVRAAGQEAILLLLLASGIRVDCASKLSKSVQRSSTFVIIPYLLPRKTGTSAPQVIRMYEENP